MKQIILMMFAFVCIMLLAVFSQNIFDLKVLKNEYQYHLESINIFDQNIWLYWLWHFLVSLFSFLYILALILYFIKGNGYYEKALWTLLVLILLLVLYTRFVS